MIYKIKAIRSDLFKSGNKAHTVSKNICSRNKTSTQWAQLFSYDKIQAQFDV